MPLLSVLLSLWLVVSGVAGHCKSAASSAGNDEDSPWTLVCSFEAVARWSFAA